MYVHDARIGEPAFGDDALRQPESDMGFTAYRGYRVLQEKKRSQEHAHAGRRFVFFFSGGGKIERMGG